MLKLTPAESDLLRPWLISRMRTGGQAMNDKALAEELDPDGSLGGTTAAVTRACLTPSFTSRPSR